MLENLTRNTSLPLAGPHIPNFIVSFLACYAIQAATHRLGPTVIGEKWNSYPERTRRSFATRVNSTIHAVMASVWAIHHLRAGTLRSDPVFGYDYDLGQFVAISAGYFLWDTIDSIRNSTIAFVIHGLACLGVFTFSFRPFMMGYGPPFLFWELSTPFLNFHWFMEKLGVSKTHPRLFLANAIAFAGIFFLARICHGGYSSILFAKSVWGARHRAPVHLNVMYSIGGMAVNTLNWLWFSKIVEKLMNRDEVKPAKPIKA